MKRYLVFAGWDEVEDGICGWEAFCLDYDTLEEIEVDRRAGYAYQMANPETYYVDGPEDWGMMDWYQVVDIAGHVPWKYMEYICWNRTDTPVPGVEGI